MVTEPRRAVPDGTSQAAAFAVGLRRASQVPSASAVPHQTALHGAAERGLAPLVKFLAENGADLQAKDANGRTPIDLAKGVKEPIPETVALLESLIAAKGAPPLSTPR
jgi:hypothetical protein